MFFKELLLLLSKYNIVSRVKKIVMLKFKIYLIFAESGGIEPHAVSRTSRLAGGLTRRRESLSICTSGGTRTRTALTDH
jgi:hypothetical protein